MINKYDIEQTLRDYHWMVREIERIRGYLAGAGERVVGQYGLESSMPKAKGGTSDPVHAEVTRREKQWARIDKLDSKVRFVQERIENITDERQRTVLDCMLDGMNIVHISYHMGLSQTHIKRIKNDLIDHLYELQKVTA